MGDRSHCTLVLPREGTLFTNRPVCVARQETDSSVCACSKWVSAWVRTRLDYPRGHREDGPPIRLLHSDRPVTSYVQSFFAMSLMRLHSWSYFDDGTSFVETCAEVIIRSSCRNVSIASPRYAERSHGEIATRNSTEKLINVSGWRPCACNTNFGCFILDIASAPR